MVTRYLHLTSLEEARSILRGMFKGVVRTERIALEDAIFRVTAIPVFSAFSVPEYPLAAMDGIAVRSADTMGASEQSPILLPSAIRVNTGNPLPMGYDAVIMIEDVWEEGGKYLIRAPVSPWHHVRPSGEDIGESEMILPSFHLVRPHEVAALSAYGITELMVRTLSVGLIPTGSELVAAGNRPSKGQVVESNTLLAMAFLNGMGFQCTRYPIIPDDPGAIRKALAAAASIHDLVIISAGSSAGTKDYTSRIISELGSVVVHGVAIKPGKPVILGAIGNKPVIGLPGYPLSALTVLREVLLPILAELGFPSPGYLPITVHLTSNLHSEIGIDEYVLLSAGKIGDRWVATPQPRGAGVQMSAVRANAYLQIPAQKEGFERGERVPAKLLVSREQGERALLVTGSHDPALDYLADLLQESRVELHSTHVGSMGGLIALQRGECHAAPMHLLAPDGSYNTHYLKTYLPDENLILLCVAEREQGIISREGLGLENITTHQFVNRQKGSGTRILLDMLLKERGIDQETIPGYGREVTTHLAAALAIKTHEADAAIGVFSAAKALNLRFVPLAQERYELVIRKDQRDDERIEHLFACVNSERFREVLRSLGGYRISKTGEIRSLP